MIKKRILDMGAGGNPRKDATDATDKLNKDEITRDRNNFIKNYGYARKYCKERGYCKKTIITNPKLNNKIKFVYNIDYNKDKLPYDDNSVDIVSSYHSLQAFGKLHAIQEIYRILKPGGYVDIGWFSDKSLDKFTEKLNKRFVIALPKHGFKNIKIFKNIKDNTLYKYQFDKKYLNVVRAYK